MARVNDLVPQVSGRANLGIDGGPNVGQFDMGSLRPFNLVVFNSGIITDPLHGQSGVLRFNLNRRDLEFSADGGIDFSGIMTQEADLNIAYQRGNDIPISRDGKPVLLTADADIDLKPVFAVSGNADILAGPSHLPVFGINPNGYYIAESGFSNHFPGLHTVQYAQDQGVLTTHSSGYTRTIVASGIRNQVTEPTGRYTVESSGTIRQFSQGETALFASGVFKTDSGAQTELISQNGFTMAATNSMLAAAGSNVTFISVAGDVTLLALAGNANFGAAKTTYNSSISEDRFSPIINSAASNSRLENTSNIHSVSARSFQVGCTSGINLGTAEGAAINIVASGINSNNQNRLPSNAHINLQANGQILLEAFSSSQTQEDPAVFKGSGILVFQNPDTANSLHKTWSVRTGYDKIDDLYPIAHSGQVQGVIDLKADHISGIVPRMMVGRANNALSAGINIRLMVDNTNNNQRFFIPAGKAMIVLAMEASGDPAGTAGTYTINVGIRTYNTGNVNRQIITGSGPNTDNTVHANGQNDNGDPIFAYAGPSEWILFYQNDASSPDVIRRQVMSMTYAYVNI